ncbi:hypothetical protein N7456_002769 [Penicillium angulare]|uniref:Tyrosine specific protein phosphatases domain-containing protein n=1 Tax=Penicillium angulare TaxID=116970 RepID=A0A9W9G8Q4_9EURO|nr:hypothetical protein N7456_002769 [Penicillium angulare]
MLEETVSSMATSPFIVVDGVQNFRDLGGYACSHPIQSSLTNVIDGTRATSWRVRSGFLFRSAQPSQITPAGIETLKKNLNIQAVFDFRSNGEIHLVQERYPDALLEIPGTKHFPVPVFENGQYSPVSLAEKYGVLSDRPDEDRNAEGGFVKAYEDIARHAAQTGSFRAVMKHILEKPDDPLVFHCTVGKDRTGVLAALILKVCGVADEDIVNDYALTTHGLGSWREHLIKRILSRNPNLSREQAERIVASNGDDMRLFLKEVVTVKFGGPRKFFVELCGLEEDEVDRIVTTLIIPK